MRDVDAQKGLRSVSAEQLRALLARIDAATGPDRLLDMDIALATRTGSFNEQLYDGCSEAMKAQTIAFSAEDAEPFDCEVCGGERIGRGFCSVPKVTESLDAAVAVAECVLPGWRWVIHNPRSGLSFGASLSDPGRGGIVAVAEKGIVSAPIALCAALLKAMIARSEV